MKQILRDKTFQKHYQKRILPHPKLVEQFDDRVRDFMRDKRDSPLNDHPLKGTKLGLRSFSITGDIRVVYRESVEAYIFLDVGTHNQVY